MKKTLLLLVVLRIVFITPIHSQWTDQGDFLITNDFVQINNENGIWLGYPNGGANAVTTNSLGFMVFKRNAFDNALSIDDDSDNFFLHPSPDGAGVRLYMVNGSIANINDAMARLQAFPGSGTELRDETGQGLQLVGTSIRSSSDAFNIHGLVQPARVGIGGNNSGSYMLEVNGDLGITGGIYGLSDVRLKRDIIEIESSLEIIKKLRPVKYFFDQSKSSKILPTQQQYGLIAQEIYKIIPSIVDSAQSNNDIMSINYMSLIPILISAIKEQQNQIDDLKLELSSKH